MDSSNFSVSFEPTPNPATMKFVLPFPVSEEGFEIPTVKESERSPLAAKLFGFPWTSSVYIGPQFVTVTKQEWVEWNILAEPLANLISEHLQSGQPVVSPIANPISDASEDDSEMVQAIKRLINQEIRPVVALDGGDIVFSHYQDQIVYLHMKGACAGCPSSMMTLKEGIETRIKEVLPEVREVVAL